MARGQSSSSQKSPYWTPKNPENIDNNIGLDDKFTNQDIVVDTPQLYITKTNNYLHFLDRYGQTYYIIKIDKISGIKYIQEDKNDMSICMVFFDSSYVYVCTDFNTLKNSLNN
jgi:hypothetical protein